MAISANKLAPSAAVLAFVGYCIWPSVSDMVFPPPPPPSPPKVPELAASLFAPTLPPPPTKNPWGGKDAESLAALKKPGTVAETPAETRVKAADPTGSATSPTNLLAGLTLDATFVAGDERMAVINGVVYSVQDVLPATVASAPDITIANVLPYSVLLEHEGTTAQLTYTDVIPSSDSSEKDASDGSKAASIAKRASAVAKSGPANRPKRSTK
jgi:hypothetical protein